MLGLISPFADVQERSTFKLFGNQINLIGADKPSKFMGAGCDLLWLNEAIHIDQKIFDQAEMRCSEFFFMDYNPEHTEHWIYETVINRPDVSFLRTTFLDNPNVPEKQKQKILSYEPTEINKKQGTANSYMWDVFGLGKRARKEGAIFKRWKRGVFDDSLPYYYGLDWGYKDAFTLTKVAINERKKIIYLKQIAYVTEQPFSKIMDIIKSNVHKEDLIVCDSSEPTNISELRANNYNAIGSFKKPGIIKMRIQWIQDYLLMVDNSPDIEHELNNYEWAEKNNIPIDKYNHAIDGFSYVYTWYRLNVLRR